MSHPFKEGNFLLKFPAVVFTQEIQYFFFLPTYLPTYLIDPQLLSKKKRWNDLMLINIVSERRGEKVTWQEVGLDLKRRRRKGEMKSQWWWWWTYQSTSFVVVQVHDKAKISSFLGWINELSCKFYAKVNVVRTSTPFPVNTIRATAISIVTRASFDLAFRTCPCYGMSYSCRCKGIDKSRFPTSYTKRIDKEWRDMVRERRWWRGIEMVR